MYSLLQRLKRFCGIIVGIVLFLSGVVKLMDPVGAGLVMNGYYDFFNLNPLEFSASTAKCMGTMFALVETLIGIALITGVWRRFIAKAALGLQIFFTLLTLILVIFNPKIDCGCFGEVIKLTHTQTFAKNLILLALLCAYAFPFSQIGHTKKKKYVMFGMVSAPALALTVYSWIYLPLVDFTDYRPGAELAAGVEISPEDMYETVFTYEKDGRTEAFSLQNLPDSTWTYVSTETREKEIAQRTIVNLSFYDRNGEYRDYLATEGKVMVVSVYDPSMSDERWEEVEGFIRRSEDAGFTTLLLCSRPEGIPCSLFDHAFISDYKTLIAMNRSNGGVTYFNNGVLIRKWARICAPDTKELEEVYDTDATEVSIARESKGSLTLQGFLLYAFAIMLLL